MFPTPLPSIKKIAGRKVGFMLDSGITHADLTWFPTAVFMEFMLPRVFGWNEVFRDPADFPKLAAWYKSCLANPVFAGVRDEIWQFWVAKEEAGQFDSIRDETKDPAFKWVYP
eukprot:g3161.t1